MERDKTSVCINFIVYYKGMLFGKTPPTDSMNVAYSYTYMQYELDESSVRIRRISEFKPAEVLFVHFKFKKYLKDLPDGNLKQEDDLPTEFEGFKTDYWIGDNGKIIA